MIVGLLLLLLAPTDPLQQTQQQGNTTAVLQFILPAGSTPENLRLSDSPTVKLIVTGPRGLEVTAPTPITRSPGWEIRKVAEAETKAPDNRREWQQTWLLAPRQPGTIALQLEPIRVREAAQGEWRNLPWKPLTLTVTTTVTRPDLSELRPSTGLELLPAEPTFSFWWVTGGLAAALLVVSLLVIRWRRRAQPALRIPSLLDELALLEQETVGDMEQTARLAEQLSKVVRAWLEQTHGLPTRRRTTPECLAALQALELPSTIPLAAISAVLNRCDLARFAQHPFSAAEWRDLLAQTRGLLQNVPEHGK